MFALCSLVSALGVMGTLTFVQYSGYVTITGTITGLTEGKHGFHIHQFGDLHDSCKAAGGHFNPHHTTHGAPTDSIDDRHVGDLGNIVADANGVATVNITDSIISFGGVNGIIGRALVVHSGEDDLGRGGDAGSLATGNAGSRVACGVITFLGNLID